MSNTNKMYAEIGRKIRQIPLDGHYVSYEWEELVQRMCDSDDTKLHTIGIKELAELTTLATRKRP
jgi:hypothetical protein